MAAGTCEPGRRLGRPTEIGVRPVEPVLPRWREDVDVQGRLERFRPVREIRWEMQDLARSDVDDLRLVLSQPETQDALEDVGDLLVLVRVPRDDAALVEVDVRQHQPVAADQPPVEERVELILRQVVPAVARRSGTGHRLLLSRRSTATTIVASAQAGAHPRGGGPLAGPTP